MPIHSHFPHRLLLGLMRDKLAALAHPEPERRRAAEIASPRLLIGLALADALADAVALGLGESRGNGQDSFDRPLPEMSPPRSSTPAPSSLLRITGRVESHAERMERIRRVIRTRTFGILSEADLALVLKSPMPNPRD